MYRLSTIIEEIYQKYAPLAEKRGLRFNLDFPDMTRRIEKPSLVRKPLSEFVPGALERAEKFRLSAAVGTGLEMAVGILLDLIPIVIAWGTIGTLLVNETLVFQWIAYPMGLYMWVLGIPDAFVLAPATLVGFIDMFIPALITSPEAGEQIRFFISALSLVQIIYLTEVGSIIVMSEVGLDMKRLFIIFLERTLIAIPLLWLGTKIFVG